MPNNKKPEPVPKSKPGIPTDKKPKHEKSSVKPPTPIPPQPKPKD